MDEAVWVATVFSKNRDRLLEGEIASLFFAGVLAQARAADLLSDEHFSVDGTLIEAWASQKSFQRKDAKREAAAGRSGESDGELSRRNAQQRNTRIDHGSRRTTSPQERRARGEVSLLRQCAD